MDTSADVLGLPAMTYVWIMGVAIVGGLVGYMNKTSKYTVVDMVKSTLTSTLTGFLAFCACFESGASMGWTLFAVGVAGLMGKRAWEDMENIIRMRAGIPPKISNDRSGRGRYGSDYPSSDYPRSGGSGRYRGGGSHRDPDEYQDPNSYEPNTYEPTPPDYPEGTGSSIDSEAQ
jgi:uncharacterized membrane protein (UPF0136 family)